MPPLARLLPPLVTAALEREGITRAELARRMGRSPAYVYNVLSGRFRSPDQEEELRRWSAALRLSKKEEHRFIIAGMLDRAPDLLRREFLRRSRWTIRKTR